MSHRHEHEHDGHAHAEAEVEEQPADEPKVLALASLPDLEGAPAGLRTAVVVALRGDVVRLALGARGVDARRDEALHVEVLRTALRTGERVLVEHDGAGAWRVIGALRTQPTPGVDRAESFRIEAGTVEIDASRRAQIVAGPAAVVLRAEEGEVETTAPRITSRAEGLHKITGRMLRLN